jgi:hypothetical protein
MVTAGSTSIVIRGEFNGWSFSLLQRSLLACIGRAYVNLTLRGVRSLVCAEPSSCGRWLRDLRSSLPFPARYSRVDELVRCAPASDRLTFRSGRSRSPRVELHGRVTAPHAAPKVISLRKAGVKGNGAVTGTGQRFAAPCSQDARYPPPYH